MANDSTERKTSCVRRPKLAAVGDRLIRTPQADATHYTLIGVSKTCQTMRELRDKMAEMYAKNPVQFTM